MLDTPPGFCAARRSVCAVPCVDHITHLVGTSLLDWQTKPYERATKAAGSDYIDLAFRELAFFSSDCAAWILGREADGPVNVFEALTGLFPMITGREPPFEAALDWLKLAYNADRSGDYVAPA